MAKFRFHITEEGTLGEPFLEKKKEEKAVVIPGAALASLFDDDDDDLDGDIPDVSADFKKIGHVGEEDEDAQPITIDFDELPDGTLSLMRWPRLKRPAVVPELVEGKVVSAIAPTAFAPFHIEASRFSDLYSTPISFSIFGMRMGRYSLTEERNEGGPTEIRLPKTIRSIGEHAFWHCDNLTEMVIPEGVTALPAGVFGDCIRLEKVIIPEGVRVIGYMSRITDQVMPDMGTFAGCHALKELQLPSTLEGLGAHTFNSCGIMRLSHTRGAAMVTVDPTAFDHSPALRWLDSMEEGRIAYEVALPPARDKIVSGDRRFGALLRIPSDFFTHEVYYFDRLAQDAFRLDFSAQMALSRLAYDKDLDKDCRRWFFDLLVKYFDKAAQFYQETSDEAACSRLVTFLETKPDMTANDMSEILRQAGLLGLSADFIAKLIEVRTRRFSTVTGFEDLDLDLVLDF